MLEIEHLVHYKILILFLSLSILIFPQVHPDKRLDRIIKIGISEILQQNYREAEKIFQQLDDEINENPLGKIYLAATLITEGYDYNIPFDDIRINSLLNQAKKIAEIQLSNDKNNLWNKYYLALAEGYTAYYKALNGNIIEALSSGLNAYNLFDQILQQDSTFKEALIAVGTYKYWRSEKLKFINWLPFIDDERDIGTKYLQNAIKNNSYNSHLASYSLIWIYIHKNEIKKAKNLAENFLKKYPNSRIYKMVLARIYEEIDLQMSISLYYQLLDAYKKLNLDNRVKIITLKHKIAIQYQKIGKKQQALDICNEILSINNLTEYEKEKLNARLKRIKIMQTELKN